MSRKRQHLPVPSEATTDRSSDAGGSIASGIAKTVFPNLVSLSVRSPNNRIERQFPLDLRMEVDEYALDIHPRPGILRRIVETLQLSEAEEPQPLRLVIRLRHCYVRAECDGVAIAAESKYRSAIEVGSYREQRVSADNASHKATIQRRAAVAASSGPAPSARFDAQASHGGERVDARSVEHVVTATRDLYEVEAVPGGWRIGDRDQGDPLKRNGCLDGQYFGRAVADHPHTCTAEFDPGRLRGMVLFRITTRDGIHVQRADGAAALSQQRSLAEQAMRDRLAAIRIESELASEITEGPGEITLLTLRCECASAAPDAASQAYEHGERRQ